MYYTKIVFSLEVQVGDAMLDEPPECGVKCHNPGPAHIHKTRQTRIFSLCPQHN